MNKNIGESPKVEFCNKCVMSMDKKFYLRAHRRHKDHSNKRNIPFKNGICNAILGGGKKYNQIDWKEREFKF